MSASQLLNGLSQKLEQKMISPDFSDPRLFPKCHHQNQFTT